MQSAQPLLLKIDVIGKVYERKSLRAPAIFVNRQLARDRHRFPKVAGRAADILSMRGHGTQATPKS
jgi:hypothetical protein